MPKAVRNLAVLLAALSLCACNPIDGVMAIVGLSMLGTDGLVHGTYTEEILPVPEALASGMLMTTRKAYQAIGAPGKGEYGSLSILGQISHELVGPEDIGNPSIGKQYFTRQDMKVIDVPRGTTFKVLEVMAVTKHGIKTIDSGQGPICFLVLADSQGEKYYTSTNAFGINREDRFVKYISASPSIKTAMLSSDSFGECRKFTFNP
ncbi:MAG: hypothetical protein WDO70_03780 [Alphaproteobacteria bacterium]